jgi:hypothetical protein
MILFLRMAKLSCPDLCRYDGSYRQKLAIPPSRASIGDVRTSNYHLAYITAKTTSYALRSSC